MTTSQATVYYKTEAGLEEMQNRQGGLNSRVRQLLILVDGKRNLLELQKLMAFAELEEFVALLELKGLIAPDPQQAVVAPLRDASGLGPMLRQAMYPTGSSELVGQVQAQSDVALAEPQGHEWQAGGEQAAGSPEPDARTQRDRQNLAGLLADAVGPMSSDMCARIQQAVRPVELAELFVASLTVVELMSGRKAADRFVEKLKNMGWDY